MTLKQQFIIFNYLTVVEVSFCSLAKGITPNIFRLCVCVKINRCSFEPFMCLDFEEKGELKQNQTDAGCLPVEHQAILDHCSPSHTGSLFTKPYWITVHQAILDHCSPSKCQAQSQHTLSPHKKLLLSLSKASFCSVQSSQYTLITPHWAIKLTSEAH